MNKSRPSQTPFDYVPPPTLIRRPILKPKMTIKTENTNNKNIHNQNPLRNCIFLISKRVPL